MKKWILPCVWVLLLSLGGAVRAEPDALAKYLMDEPVSLMDFGVYRLDRRVREVMEAEHNAIGAARYDWDRNRIILTGFINEKSTGQPEGVRLKCKEMISSLRYVLGVNADTGESIFGSNSMIDQYFLHKGYKTASQPEKLSDGLAGMVELQAAVAAESGEQLKCSGPLLGTVIYFSK